MDAGNKINYERVKTLKHTSTYTIPERVEWRRGRDKHEHASIRIPQHVLRQTAEPTRHVCDTDSIESETAFGLFQRAEPTRNVCDSNSIESETVSMGVVPDKQNQL